MKKRLIIVFVLIFVLISLGFIIGEEDEGCTIIDSCPNSGPYPFYSYESVPGGMRYFACTYLLNESPHYKIATCLNLEKYPDKNENDQWSFTDNQYNLEEIGEVIAECGSCNSEKTKCDAVYYHRDEWVDDGYGGGDYIPTFSESHWINDQYDCGEMHYRCGDGTTQEEGRDRNISTEEDNEELDDGTHCADGSECVWWDLTKGCPDGSVCKPRATVYDYEWDGYEYKETVLYWMGLGGDAKCKYEDEYCGDGITNRNEQCDDGNRVNGDGCTSNCKDECENVFDCKPGYSCIEGVCEGDDDDKPDPDPDPETCPFCGECGECTDDSAPNCFPGEEELICKICECNSPCEIKPVNGKDKVDKKKEGWECRKCKNGREVADKDADGDSCKYKEKGTEKTGVCKNGVCGPADCYDKMEEGMNVEKIVSGSIYSEESRKALDALAEQLFKDKKDELVKKFENTPGFCEDTDNCKKSAVTVDASVSIEPVEGEDNQCSGDPQSGMVSIRTDKKTGWSKDSIALKLGKDLIKKVMDEVKKIEEGFNCECQKNIKTDISNIELHFTGTIRPPFLAGYLTADLDYELSCSGKKPGKSKIIISGTGTMYCEDK